MSDWRNLMSQGKFAEAELEMISETGPSGLSGSPHDPESQGWFYETWGDAIATNADAIDKYRIAYNNFTIFASWSTSGGEGTARSNEAARVCQKLKSLES